MSNDSISIVWLVGALVLAVSALTARRLSFGAVMRSLLGWAVVAAFAWFVVINRPQLESLFGSIGERLGIGGQEVVGETVRITMSADGHFWARVTMNGFTKRMLVDSGATITALSLDTARAARLDVDSVGFPVMITTANGSITAQRANVQHVSVGSLDTKDLGVVVSPNFGETDVLGMNFLSRLGSWRVEGRTLILEPAPSRP